MRNAQINENEVIIVKMLPLGIQNFKEMIDGNFIYVDKTQHIYNLLNGTDANVLFWESCLTTHTSESSSIHPAPNRVPRVNLAFLMDLVYFVKDVYGPVFHCSILYHECIGHHNVRQC